MPGGIKQVFPSTWLRRLGTYNNTNTKESLRDATSDDGMQDLHDVEGSERHCSARRNSGAARRQSTSTHHNEIIVEFPSQGIMRKPSGTVGCAASVASNDSSASSSEFAVRSVPSASSIDGHASTLSTRSFMHLNRSYTFVLLILLTGAGIAAAFVSFGYMGATADQDLRLELQATELVSAVESSWHTYTTAAAWVHEACRITADHTQSLGNQRICTREDFYELYRYIEAEGFQFQAIEFIPRVEGSERAAFEDEARLYFEKQYPSVSYRGFVGFEPDPTGGVSVQPRSQQPFYYPVHYLQPVATNEAAAGFDLYSSSSRRKTIDSVLTTWKPAVTDRLTLVQDKAAGPPGYSVLLLHPGTTLSTHNNSMLEGHPTSLSLVIIRISELLKRATAGQAEGTCVYLYDEPLEDGGPPVFLGGAHVDVIGGEIVFHVEEEIALADLRSLVGSPRRIKENHVQVEQRTWLVAVVAHDGTYEPNMLFVTLGGIVIFLACLCLAVWFYTNMRRAAKLSQVKAAAESEKAALVLESARNAATSERELNDYIAHEVRNPLAAAMSACIFVSSALEVEPVSETSRIAALEDTAIMGSSLAFINDLLRSMLDMHRAATGQMSLEKKPTDLLRDVLEPVATMLHRRGDNVEIIVETPSTNSPLVVFTDRMRLKQIVLNLANNSRKFVQKGYIRLRAEVVHGKVELAVEDSGPGIPFAKRGQLFSKFQESLDSLNQGTGIGLCLSKQLAELLRGEILLDESFHSGVEGCPGTRFVIKLNVPPQNLAVLEGYESGAMCTNQSPSVRFDVAETGDGDSNQCCSGIESGRGNEIGSSSKVEGRLSPTEESTNQTCSALELPEHLSVLVVDDDFILRKLISRSIKRAAPGWQTKEVANGETALRLVDTETFDVIFMDQYMASVEKQLLGTEAIVALRAKGVKSRICGLSANDLEDTFLSAGADAFILKPFPCEKEKLERKLIETVYGKEVFPSSHEEQV